jgi:hypothetical protein
MVSEILPVEKEMETQQLQSNPWSYGAHDSTNYSLRILPQLLVMPS